MLNVFIKSIKFF